ncbi:DUF373 family protein [Candidatus Micrarchaeota archaeon]|nr:DUF373 family protein [Candidatus Micrarchaeota archaeon]
MEEKRILVLSVDIDNDVGEKARIKGPIVGRKENLDAALKLGEADPEDTDVNTIFYAVKIYDELSKQHKQAQVVTLTGDAHVDYHAQSEVVKQLEKVILEFSPEACVFVSDGASDESIIPLIQTRVRIVSIKTVTVKQAKELEKTYFVILEKLKEPQIAGIVFGIPGVALLLFAFSEFLGIRVLLGVLGSYLIFKGIGLEARFLRLFSRTRISFDKANFIFYFAAIAFLVISIILGVNEAFVVQSLGLNNLPKEAALVLKEFLKLLPVSILLIVIGEVLQAIQDKRTYVLPNYIVSGSGLMLFWLIANNAADWIVGVTAFGEFFYSLILGIIAMTAVTYLAREFKRAIISRMNLEGKDAYTDIGGFIGKVVGINKRRETLILQTSSNQKIDLEFGNVAEVGDKIIIRY